MWRVKRRSCAFYALCGPPGDTPRFASARGPLRISSSSGGSPWRRPVSPQRPRSLRPGRCGRLPRFRGSRRNRSPAAWNQAVGSEVLTEADDRARQGEASVRRCGRMRLQACAGTEVVDSRRAGSAPPRPFLLLSLCPRGPCQRKKGTMKGSLDHFTAKKRRVEVGSVPTATGCPRASYQKTPIWAPARHVIRAREEELSDSPLSALLRQVGKELCRIREGVPPLGLTNR